MPKENQATLPGIPTPKLSYFVVNYKWANPKGQMRTGQLLLNANNAEEAIARARLKLSDLDWYRIGAVRKEPDIT